MLPKNTLTMASSIAIAAILFSFVPPLTAYGQQLDLPRVRAMVMAAVTPCINPPRGVKGRISIRIRLAPDGRHMEAPTIVAGQKRGDLADTALIAVTSCGPYRFPPELYKGGWEDVTLTIDLR
jgi:hypothetical protein